MDPWESSQREGLKSEQHESFQIPKGLRALGASALEKTSSLPQTLGKALGSWAEDRPLSPQHFKLSLLLSYPFKHGSHGNSSDDRHLLAFPFLFISITFHLTWTLLDQNLNNCSSFLSVLSYCLPPASASDQTIPAFHN